MTSHKIRNLIRYKNKTLYFITFEAPILSKYRTKIRKRPIVCLYLHSCYFVMFFFWCVSKIQKPTEHILFGYTWQWYLIECLLFPHKLFPLYSPCKIFLEGNLRWNQHLPPSQCTEMLSAVPHLKKDKKKQFKDKELRDKKKIHTGHFDLPAA